MAKKRTYDSPLRARRAEETRRRVLEAAMALLQQGAAALTVPAVAREAGVSVPTVYRHFSTKEALEDAVAEYARELVGVQRTPPEDLAGLEAIVANIWERCEELPTGALAALLANIARELDEGAPTDRQEFVAQPLAADHPELSEADLYRLSACYAALIGTTGFVGFRRLGIGGTEAATLVNWLLQTALAGLEAKAGD